MFHHPQFSENSPDFWRCFVQEHPLALLIQYDGDTFYGTHLPLLFLEEPNQPPLLAGHLPKANPQAALCARGSKALAVFATPAAYVSGHWYDIPSVPTMNYEAVHIQGTLRAVSGERLQFILQEMTDRLEKLFNQHDPLVLQSLSADYLAANYQALLGFELEVEKVEATRKLSQNKSPEDRRNVIHHLLKRRRPEDFLVAEKMIKLLKLK